jgi:hypothetical protein
MTDKTPRQIRKLLKMIEEREDEIYRCEEEIERSRKRLENKERGWSKARFQKIKIRYTEKIRGLRGTINRLEKQRLNIERREKEKEEEEKVELERTLAVEEEEEREKTKKKRAKKRMKKGRVKKKKVKKKKKKVKKELSEKEMMMYSFTRTFVKSYRGGIKGAFDKKKKKKRKRFELYGKYPYRVTVVYKEPEIVETETEEKTEGEESKKKVVKVKEASGEVMLVFSSPGSEELVIDSVEEKGFNIADYKDIFRTLLIDVKRWSAAEAEAVAKEYLEKDLE